MIQPNVTVEWPFEYSCTAPIGRQHPERTGVDLIGCNMQFESRTDPGARRQGSGNSESEGGSSAFHYSTQ